MNLNYVFVAALLALVVLAALVFLINKVRKTNDLTEIMTRLMLEDPTTVSFSLGWDEARKSYRNVYMDDKTSEADVKWEKYPVNQRGKFIIPAGQGRVSDRDDGNGFVVTGMELVDFICPPGYSDSAGGGNCKLKPLCEKGAADHLQPLTYTQFNALNLYRNDFSSNNVPPPTITPLDDDVEPIHARIRVQCHKDGTYELETCEENRLIDPETLSCRVYDLCEDRMSGYKHNLPIDDDASPPLASDEYYLCSQNRSVKTKCAEGTVFSRSNQGCVVKSPCYGKGDVQLPLDETHYLQCGNDVGRRVECSDGVVETDDGKGGKILSCRVKTCTPSVSRFDDGLLAFDDGAVICVPPTSSKSSKGTMIDSDDYVPKVIRCDRTRVPRTVRARWIDEFDLITFDNWPKEIYSRESQSCVPLAADDEATVVKDGATRSVAWSLLMSESHPYDVKARRYVCDDESTRYRWDYSTGTMSPAKITDEDSRAGRTFVDTAGPCQTTAKRPIDLPWQGTRVMGAPPLDFSRSIYEGGTALPMPSIAGIYIGFHDLKLWSDPKNESAKLLDIESRKFYENMNLRTWPCYDSTNKTYFGHTIHYDVANRMVAVTNFKDNNPPLGFALYDEETVEKYPVVKVSQTVTRLRLLGSDGILLTDNGNLFEAIDGTIFYVVASGITDRITFSPKASKNKLTILCPKKVDTRDIPEGEARLFYVLWPAIRSDDERFAILAEEKLVITNKGFLSKGRILDSPTISGLYVSKKVHSTDGSGKVIDWTFEFRYGNSSLMSEVSNSELTFDLP